VSRPDAMLASVRISMTCTLTNAAANSDVTSEGTLRSSARKCKRRPGKLAVRNEQGAKLAMMIENCACLQSLLP
jgi:hypothetical protein